MTLDVGLAEIVRFLEESCHCDYCGKAGIDYLYFEVLAHGCNRRIIGQSNSHSQRPGPRLSNVRRTNRKSVRRRRRVHRKWPIERRPILLRQRPSIRATITQNSQFIQWVGIRRLNIHRCVRPRLISCRTVVEKNVLDVGGHRIREYDLGGVIRTRIHHCHLERGVVCHGIPASGESEIVRSCISVGYWIDSDGPRSSSRLKTRRIGIWRDSFYVGGECWEIRPSLISNAGILANGM